jgi:hypothetical protein
VSAVLTRDLVFANVFADRFVDAGVNAVNSG